MGPLQFVPKLDQLFNDNIFINIHQSDLLQERF